MKSFVRSNWKFVSITLVLTVFTAILTMVIPILLSNVFQQDYKLNYRTVVYLIIFMFIAYTLQIIMVIIRENFTEKFNSNYAKSLYKKLFKMKYDEILKREPTYLIERIGQSVDSLYMFISNSLVGIISNVIIISVSLILLMRINLFVALFLLLLLPINYLGYRAINKSLHKKSMFMQKETAAGYKEINSVFKNIDAVKQEAKYNRIERLIEPSLNRIYQSRSKINKFGQSTSLMIKLFNNFIQNMMFFSLGYLIYTSDTSIGDLIIVSIIFPIYFTAVQSITNINLEIRDIKVAKEFIDEELLSTIEDEKGTELSSINYINFDEVIYEIDNKEYHFFLNTQVKKGDIVYVDGPSGAGKSSLMKLLLKFRKSSGIIVNDSPIKDISPTSLRDNILYISQDFTLLPMSLKNNILFGKEDSGIDWEKLSDTSLLKSILTKKNLNSEIYEYGTNLSGGEKQRLMLSRILIEKYDVIILDEVTSNIDKDSSALIFETLLKENENKIIFVISHDKTNEAYCNKSIRI